MQWVRVKTQLKQLCGLQVTAVRGKPCALKCPIGIRLRAARPMYAGRQIQVLCEQHRR